MKKTLTALVLAAAAICGVQHAQAQFRYGVTVGADVTNIKFNQTLFDIDRSVGYHAGVLGELMFPGIGFGIDFGLQYTQRGATLDLGSREVWHSQGYGRERSYLHCIDLPIDLRFKWTRMNGLEDHIAPYVFGGPVFSFLAGHSDIKALEYPFCSLGLQCGIGFELYKHWQVQGAYQWGMTYCMRTKLLDDFSARNSTWSVGVTYMF